MAARLHRQLHGYRSGHQLLHSTTRIERRDQDLVDQLSDMAGPLRPGEKFDPYISAYPLPSAEYYVLARTEQDHAAPRAGCVMTKSLLVPQSYWERDASPAELVELLERPGRGRCPARTASRAGWRSGTGKQSSACGAGRGAVPSGAAAGRRIRCGKSDTDLGEAVNRILARNAGCVQSVHVCAFAAIARGKAVRPGVCPRIDTIAVF